MFGKMKVKHALGLSIASVLLMTITGYLYYDGTHMSSREVKKHLEDFHKTEIKDIIEEVPTSSKDKSNKSETMYTLVTKDDITFNAVVKIDTKSKKQYVSASTFEQAKSDNVVDKELAKIVPALEEQGFTLYIGGEKQKAEDNPYTKEDESKAQVETVAPVQKPYQTGVTSENTIITRISLLYEKPLTIFELTDEYEKIFNAVKLVCSLDIKSPYLDIRGKDGDYTSGRLLLTDLDNLTSSEDVAKQIEKALETTEQNKDLPSVTLSDEELKELGIDPKAKQPEQTDKQTDNSSNTDKPSDK